MGGGARFPCFEALHAACGVQKFLPTGVEGVTAAADLRLDLRFGGPRGERGAAGAADFCFRIILGVNILFHGRDECLPRTSAVGGQCGVLFHKV